MPEICSPSVHTGSPAYEAYKMPEKESDLLVKLPRTTAWCTHLIQGYMNGLLQSFGDSLLKAV